MTVIDYSLAIRQGYQRLRQFGKWSLGRILGTTTDKDRRYLFFMDLAEAKLFHRAELNALVFLLVEKGVITNEDWSKAVQKELELAVKEQQEKWPEVTPLPDGRGMTINTELAKKRIDEEGWPR